MSPERQRFGEGPVDLIVGEIRGPATPGYFSSFGLDGEVSPATLDERIDDLLQPVAIHAGLDRGRLHFAPRRRLFAGMSGGPDAWVSSNALSRRTWKSSSAALGLGEGEIATVHERLGVELAHAAAGPMSSYIFGCVKAGSSPSLWP